MNPSKSKTEPNKTGKKTAPASEKPKPATAKASAIADPKTCSKCGIVHERCTGHRKRKNTGGKWVACMNYPLRASRTRKCKHCGGASPKGAASPQFVDGRRSKYTYLPAVTAKRVESLTGDAIANIEENINIQRAFESRMAEKLGTGESRQGWEQLKTAFQSLNRLERSHSAYAIGALTKIGESAADVRASVRGEEPDDPLFDDLMGEIASAISDTMRAGANKLSSIEKIELIIAGALSDTYLMRDITGIHETQRKLAESLTKCRKEVQETYTLEQFQDILGIVIRVIRNHVTDRKTLSKIQDGLILETQQFTGEPFLDN